MGVDAFADIVVAAYLRGAKPLQQLDMIGTFNVEHIKMRQVDDAAVVAQRELFGIGNTPEVAVVPFRLADRHLVTVFLQKVFVGRITMRALPAAEFHEMAAEFDFPFIER